MFVASPNFLSEIPIIIAKIFLFHQLVTEARAQNNTFVSGDTQSPPQSLRCPYPAKCSWCWPKEKRALVTRLRGAILKITRLFWTIWVGQNESARKIVDTNAKIKLQFLWKDSARVVFESSELIIAYDRRHKALLSIIYRLVYSINTWHTYYLKDDYTNYVLWIISVYTN